MTINLMKAPEPSGKVVMIQGTGSSVGKSLLVTGLCRVFTQDGYRVAPFKAQNMSRNSGVTPDGLEIGRAQIAQAQAAGIEPSVEMNLVLIKPEGNSTAQLVAMGKMSGKIYPREYLTRRELLWEMITESLATLRSGFDIVVIEGAGSPAEINLRAGDIVNMAVALHSNAPVFIIGDIDKGGVFASLYGTHALISDQERKLIKGFIVNKFRGDPSLLGSGLDQLAYLTGVPVIGVVPYFTDIYVPEEDSPSEASKSHGDADDASVEIAIIGLPCIANFDEFDILGHHTGVRLRYVLEASEFGKPDLVIIPGSKVTVADLDFVRRSDIEPAIRNHLWNGRPLIGICAGLQILGKKIVDTGGIESEQLETEGLGILDIDTRFSGEKTTTRTVGKFIENRGLLSETVGLEVSGYEIHVGISDSHSQTSVAMKSINGGRPIGYLDRTGRIFGTYVHDLFKNSRFTELIIQNITRMKGIEKQPDTQLFSQNAEFDKLASHLREHMDIKAIYRSMGI